MSHSLLKFSLLLLTVPAFMAGDCENKKEKLTNEKKDTTAIPVCVKKILDEAAKEIPANLPLQVDEYSFRGKTVFLFTADCCDFYNVVYSDSCVKICAPSGGITGKGDGQCPEFSKEARHVKLIWKKEQK